MVGHTGVFEVGVSEGLCSDGPESCQVDSPAYHWRCYMEPQQSACSRGYVNNITLRCTLAAKHE